MKYKGKVSRRGAPCPLVLLCLSSSLSSRVMQEGRKGPPAVHQDRRELDPAGLKLLSATRIRKTEDGAIGADIAQVITVHAKSFLPGSPSCTLERFRSEGRSAGGMGLRQGVTVVRSPSRISDGPAQLELYTRLIVQRGR